MKKYLILALIFSVSITFAQNDKQQMEPVKQEIESKDIKKEMKEIPASIVEEPEIDLNKLDDVIDEELNLLEETEEMELEEERELEEFDEIKMKKDNAKEKLKIQAEEPESEEE